MTFIKMASYTYDETKRSSWTFFFENSDGEVIIDSADRNQRMIIKIM